PRISRRSWCGSVRTKTSTSTVACSSSTVTGYRWPKAGGAARPLATTRCAGSRRSSPKWFPISWPRPSPTRPWRPRRSNTMPMNLDSVGAVSQPSRSSWTSKDALLYAVGVGAGQTDPTGFELEFTTENSTDIQQMVLPTIPVVISVGGGPGRPSRGEFDFRLLLHGEQGVTVHGPIPADGEVETVARIVGIYDKGKAAVIRLENKATYVDSGKPAFDTRFAAFIRGEGGFGESRGDEIADPPKMPDRAADHEVTY